MRSARALATVAGLAVICGLASVVSLHGQSAVRFRLEPNLDRSGNDIRKDVLPADAGIEMCEQRCRETRGCVAFTFVKRSTTVPAPICWLKDMVPVGYPSSCCTSGVVEK